MSKQGFNRWTEEEVDTLKTLTKSGKSYSSIAKKLDGRSENAVKCKLESLVYYHLDNKKSKTSIMKELGKTEEEIQELYDNHKARQPKQSSTKSNDEKPKPKTATKAEPEQTTSLGAASYVKYAMINRLMTPMIEYYENLNKLEKLKDKDSITEDFYNKTLKILQSKSINNAEWLKQLECAVTKSCISPVKSDSHTDESEVSDVEDLPEENKFPKKRLI